MEQRQAGTDGDASLRPPEPVVRTMARRSLLGAPLSDHATRGSAFLLVGATSAALTFLAYLLLTTGWSVAGKALAQGLGIEVHAASALAWETGILWSFAGHSLLTFRTLRTTRGLGHRFLRFHAVALVGLAVSQAAFAFFHDLLLLASPWPMVLAIPVATPFNYLAQRYWTWGDPGRAAAGEGAR